MLQTPSSKKKMGEVGGRWVHVLEAYGNCPPQEVFVPKGQKVKELKQSLCERIDGLGAREAKLIFAGKVLDDEDLVEAVMHADSSTMKALAADPDQHDTGSKDLRPTLHWVKAEANRRTRSRSDDLGESRMVASEPRTFPGTSSGGRPLTDSRQWEAKDTPAPLQCARAPEEHPRRAAARAAVERTPQAAAWTPPAASEREPDVEPDVGSRDPAREAQAAAPMLDAASIPVMQNLYLQQMHHFLMWQQTMMAYNAHVHAHSNGQMSPNDMPQGGLWAYPFGTWQQTMMAYNADVNAHNNGQMSRNGMPQRELWPDQLSPNGIPSGGVCPPVAASPFPNQHVASEARASPPAERQGRANGQTAAPAQDQAAANGRVGVNGDANERDAVGGEGRGEMPPGIVRRIMDVGQGFIEEGGGWTADVQYLFASFLCSLLPFWNPQPTPFPVDLVEADAHQDILQNDHFNGNPEGAHPHAD